MTTTSFLFVTLAATAGVLLSCSSSLLFATSSEPSLRYAVMIDAGSSGSRIHVHPYSLEISKGASSLPKIEASLNKKITPGLSSFTGGREEEAGASLVPLLDFARSHVPLSLRASTGIFLKATAGLRAIDPASAERILDSCRVTLSASGFHFRPANVQLISGTWEGLYGWITANYLEGAFDHPHPEAAPKQNRNDDDSDDDSGLLPVVEIGGASSKSHTVGVIEMGGASMQVTFVPNDADARSRGAPYVHRLSIGGHEYPVYTHSYLNYGLEKAQEVLLSRDRSAVTNNGHPCYLHGFESDNNTPDVQTDDFRGVGDYGTCRSLVDELWDTSCREALRAARGGPVCSFDDVYQPVIGDERFYAIENFFYTSEFFGVLDHPDPFAELEKKGKEYCKRAWHGTPETFRDESEQDLAKYCFSAAYLPSVLRVGLGITNPSRTAQIRQKIAGQKLDWALGAVLYDLITSDAWATTLREHGVHVPDLAAAERPGATPEADANLAEQQHSTLFVWILVIGCCLGIYRLVSPRKSSATSLAGKGRWRSASPGAV